MKLFFRFLLQIPPWGGACSTCWAIDSYWVLGLYFNCYALWCLSIQIGTNYGITFSLVPGAKWTTHKNVIPGPVKLCSSSQSTAPSLFPLSRHQWLWSINTILCQYATLSPLSGSADSWTLHPIITLNWVQLFIDMTCKSVLLGYCMTEPDIGH